MHNSLKIIKTLLYSYSALHVSGILAPIIRILLILHIQPPVTLCRWVGCIFQLWSVTVCIRLVFLCIVVIADARNHEPEILYPVDYYDCSLWNWFKYLSGDSVIDPGMTQY
jgi:hypothetical protein